MPTHSEDLELVSRIVNGEEEAANQGKRIKIDKLRSDNEL